MILVPSVAASTVTGARAVVTVNAGATSSHTVSIPDQGSANGWTPAVSVVDPNGDVQLLNIGARTATTCTVQLQNADGLNARTVTVCVTAIKD